LYPCWVSMGIERILSSLKVYYEKIVAEGHENIKATHSTTLEITKEGYLTPRGTCIIGIRADKAASDLSSKTKQLLRTSGYKVYLLIIVKGRIDIAEARSDPRLILADRNSIVIRKSDYIDDRTVAVNADKAARDIDRTIVKDLTRGEKLTAYLVITEENIKNFIKSLKITEYQRARSSAR